MKKIMCQARIALSAIMFSAAVCLPALAQSGPGLTGVVELFTSQGCSSCPPADAALEEYVNRDDILALSYHVDYWDYMGWKDTLASPENTARQYAYQKTFDARSVYTPQTIINGSEHVIGSRTDSISAKLAAHEAQGTGLTVPVSISDESGRLKVNVGSGKMPVNRDVQLVVAYFKNETGVEITRGENAGRTFIYRNAVTKVQILGMWDGMKMSVDIPATEVSAHNADGCAVLLQTITEQGTPGTILGAAKMVRYGS